MALTDTFVRQVKYSGRTGGDKVSDGHGLYLFVTPVGKYWRLAYRFAGKQKTLALGVYPAVGLAKARQKREQARELLASGVDPSAAKRADRAAAVAAVEATFEAVARDWMTKTSAKRTASTQAKIKGWLEQNLFPFMGRMPIGSIGPRDVLAVVQKAEMRGAVETAHRLKQLCGQIFRFAVVSGLAERDVTADLTGALTSKTKTHHSAITDPKAAGALMRSIHSYSGHPTTIAALKLAPLVFVRPGELRTAEWAEVDLTAEEWRIPAAKMKMDRDHVVPLSEQACAILKGLHPLTGHGRYVFPSIRTGERPMSENTINAALRALGYDQQTHTGHGFRAMARTIMDEVLGERVDLVEHQLAHAVKDVNGRAYNRTAHLPARKEMMQRWANYLDKLRAGADVIPIRQAG